MRTLPVEWPALRTAVEAAGWECELPYEVVEPGEGDVECTSSRSDGTAVVSGAEEGRVEVVTVTFEGPVPSEELFLWATASGGGGEPEDWLLAHFGESVEEDVGGVHIAMSRGPVTLKVTPREDG